MYLFINASQKGEITLGVVTTDGISYQKHEGDYKLTEKLLFFVMEIVQEFNGRVQDLEGIITVTGPGAFTSLRLSATVTNMLLATYKIPVYGDVLENLNTDDKIRVATSKVSLENQVIPYYDKEPNITM